MPDILDRAEAAAREYGSPLGVAPGGSLVFSPRSLRDAVEAAIIEATLISGS